MSAVVATCCCGSIGADPSKVRRCDDHYRYWRGDKELASVSKVIRDTWPLKKNFEAADPAVLENARDRGVVTDQLFSDWLMGRLTQIPADTRKDAIERFNALCAWWRTTQNGSQAVTQQILADDEIAGTADIVTDGSIVMDVKNVSALDQTYWLQLGAYAELYAATFGELPFGAAMVHVTQPKDKLVSVKYVEIDLAQALADWKALRAMWKMVQRRTK